MSKLKKSLINMIMGGALYAVPIALNILFTPLLLHKLGESAYGLQTLVNVVIGYFMVADLGMDIPLIKLISEYNAKNDQFSLVKIFNTTFQYYCVIGILGMISIGFLSDIFINKIFDIPIELHAEAKKVFLLIGLGFVGNVLGTWGRGICIGFQRYDIANGINIFNNLFSTLLGVLLVIFGYGVVGYVIIRVVVSFFSGIAYIYFSQRLLPGHQFILGFNRFVWKLLKPQIGYSFILRIGGMLIMGLDRTFIGAWLGVAAVSMYVIPFFIANSLSLVIQSMVHFIYPMTSELHSTNKSEELISLFLRGSKFIVILSSLLFFPLLLFGDKFLILWVEAGFAAQTSATLFLLSTSYYINTLLYAIANVFMVGIGKIGASTFYTVSRYFIIAIGCFFLIKPYGIKGAGIAFLISCIVDLVFILVTIKKHLNISVITVILKSYLKPFLLAIFIGIICYFLRPIASSWKGLIVSCSIFVFLYIAAGYYFNMLEEEKKIVIRLWKKIRINRSEF